MKVSVFNPIDGSRLSDGVVHLNLGEVGRGSYSSPAMIKPVRTMEHSILEMRLFLQSSGSSSSLSSHFFTSDAFVPDVGRNNVLTGQFSAVTGLTDWAQASMATGGAPIHCASGMPQDFVWLDAGIGPEEPTGKLDINFRFLYDYN